MTRIARGDAAAKTVGTVFLDGQPLRRGSVYCLDTDEGFVDVFEWDEAGRMKVDNSDPEDLKLLIVRKRGKVTFDRRERD